MAKRKQPENEPERQPSPRSILRWLIRFLIRSVSFGVITLILACLIAWITYVNRTSIVNEVLARYVEPFEASMESIDLWPIGEVRIKNLTLSPKEYKILELFIQNPKRVWSRDQLLEKIWGVDFIGDTKTVDVHIRWLREKVEDEPSSPQLIRTVRGFGYRFG